MKLTKQTLKQIIKEELQKVINEGMSSSDLVDKIEQMVLSGREGYNQAEALVDYALPMMNPQDADYIDVIFQAGRARIKYRALGNEISHSLKNDTLEVRKEKTNDFKRRLGEYEEEYRTALDKIEDMKGDDIRTKIDRVFWRF